MATANLILGDCIEKMKELPSESVDLVLTDPPYGLNKEMANDTKDGLAKLLSLSLSKRLSEWQKTGIASSSSLMQERTYHMHLRLLTGHSSFSRDIYASTNQTTVQCPITECFGSPKHYCFVQKARQLTIMEMNTCTIA